MTRLWYCTIGGILIGISIGWFMKPNRCNGIIPSEWGGHIISSDGNSYDFHGSVPQLAPTCKSCPVTGTAVMGIDGTPYCIMDNKVWRPRLIAGSKVLCFTEDMP